MEKEEIRYLHLHVPHTGGRSLHGILWHNSVNFQKVHNAKAIEEFLLGLGSLSNTPLINEIIPKSNRYFVLREPVERAYKEFRHYSKNLQTIGRVNHLILDDLKKDNKSFNPASIDDYFSLECNRNVYCKFLLLKKDFNRPITDIDFEHLKDLIKSDRIVFDRFVDGKIQYLNLRKILNLNDDIKIDINMHPTNSSCDISNDEKSFLEKCQMYDLKLYQLLC